MDKIEILKIKQFYEVINEKKFHTVFQPIISLKNAKILGYEALTRLDLDDCILTIEEFFHIAEELGYLWKVEEMTRKKALDTLKEKDYHSKLFINVDPNVIKDPLFQSGVTKSYLESFNLSPEQVVFEITERHSINDASFQNIVQHYKNQNFELAIDDFGNGYAGMNRICALNPKYIKIDREIITDINQNTIKQSIVESMVHLCLKNNICLIAEGIETNAELETLIQLGVCFGQGYLIQKPNKERSKIIEELVQKIQNTYQKNQENEIRTVSQLKKEIEIPFHLHPKSLVIDGNTGIKEAIQIAMKRDESEVFEEIYLHENDKVVGYVDMKDLIRAYTR